MIQCDLCEDWYHASCVGIPDDSVHLIDLFVCPHCETSESSPRLSPSHGIVS